MKIEYEILAPRSPEALAKGCDCPDPEAPASSWSTGAVLVCGGHFFSPTCPLHGPAVRSNVQKLFAGAKVQ